MNHYNLKKIRLDFPILSDQLIYLDNAATTQKPNRVIERIQHYYKYENANIHRGAYQLSANASDIYASARKTIQRFINAKSEKEIIFTSGTTESINLVAQTFGRENIKPGDEIIISAMEHHANILPWQQLCQQVGAKLKIIPIDERGDLDLIAFEKMMNKKVKLIAIIHVSNVLGTINPIKKITTIAHQHNIPVLVDGAQAAPILPIDVQALDCDFYAFSGHKMYGPTGIGILYGKESILNSLPPYKTGGGMIERVDFEKSSFAPLPEKFEAGTPNIAGALGLEAAIKYLENISFENVHHHEKELLNYALEQLSKIPRLTILGDPKNRAPLISFTLKNIHPHDLATLLDAHHICIRAGHHCAMPLMNHLKVPATARISFACYNTKMEIDQLANAIQAAQEVLA